MEKNTSNGIGMNPPPFLQAHKSNITSDKMVKLTELAKKQTLLEDKSNESIVEHLLEIADNTVSIASLEVVLQAKKKELEKLSREEIPAIMNELELSEIKLKTGKKIIVKDEVKPSVSKAVIYKVQEQMIKLEMDRIIGDEQASTQERLTEIHEQAQRNISALFKENIVMEYNHKNVQTLLKNECVFDQDMSIHHQTLKKYCKERIEAGQKLPADIKIFQYQETKIK